MAQTPFSQLILQLQEAHDLEVLEVQARLAEGESLSGMGWSPQNLVLDRGRSTLSEEDLEDLGVTLTEGASRQGSRFNSEVQQNESREKLFQVCKSNTPTRDGSCLEWDGSNPTTVNSLIQRHISKAVSRENHRNANSYLVSQGLQDYLSVQAIASNLHHYGPHFIVDQKPWLQNMVEHPLFDSMCAVLIVCQAILIGITTDLAARSGDTDAPVIADVIDIALTLFFLVELFIRFLAAGLIEFFSGRDFKWNIFDFFVVSFNVVDYVLRGAGQQEMSLGAIRMLRILRIARAIRIIRIFRIFKGLRMMLLSILRSGMLLIWSMVMLIMIIYIFGIYFMQGVTDALHGDREDVKLSLSAEDRLTLEASFGTMADAVYTLFLSMSGGLDWDDVAVPLGHIHWTNKFVMSFYIFFTVFAMLNIITGIFVDTAVNSARADKNEVLEEESSNKKEYIKKLYNIFKIADIDGSGTLTAGEFERMIQRDDVRALFASMDMEINEARDLFDVLDHDLLGEVNASQFIVGCMRVKGGAKGVDLMSLMQENKKMWRAWRTFFMFCEEEFRKLEGMEERLASLLSGHRGRGSSRLTTRHSTAHSISTMHSNANELVQVEINENNSSPVAATKRPSIESASSKTPLQL